LTAIRSQSNKHSKVTALPPKLAGLATIPETGPAPTQRISKVVDARKLSDTLKLEDLSSGRSYIRKLVNGLVGGAPPFSSVPPDLAWIPNINFLEAAAQIETARVPYYQLLNVQSYADINSPFSPDDPNHDEWEAKIEKYFHEMITRWPEWYWEYQRKDYEMLKHGIGPVMFEDYPNWRFRALDAGAMKVPRDTPSCVSARMPYCSIFTDERVHTLWKHIRNPKAATDAGWNVPAVRKVIMYAMKGDKSLQSWDYYERILLYQDLTASFSDGDIVKCVTLLGQEFDGKISRLMFPEGGFSTPNSSNESEVFMFEDIGKYDEYGQCVIVFFQELGDQGTWHSVKGLGQKGFRYHSVINQMNCRMLAGAEMATGLTLQLGDAKSKDAMNLVQRGLVTYIPPGVKVIQQAQSAGFLDGPITVVRVLDNRMAANLGQASPRTLSRDDGKGEMPTATQIDAQVTKESSLSQGQIALHYTTKDALFTEMFRRASMKGTSDEEAKRFQKQCSTAGVPEEALKDCVIRANRLSGYGSAQMRQLSDQQMLQSGAVAAMPAKGQQNFWRYYTGGVKGADKVDAFFPLDNPVNRDQIDAEMENGLIAQGKTPLLYGDDLIHAQSHLDDASKTLGPVEQAMQQGQNDPQQIQSAYQYLQIMGVHLEYHIARLKTNKFRVKEAKLFQDQLNQLVAFNAKLHGALRDIQRQQSIDQQQQGLAVALGALDQAKVKSAQIADTIKATTAQSDIQRKNLKASNDSRLKTITTLHTLALKNAEAKAKPEPANA
jgi:AcrR family transcriptional regulator